MKRNLEFNGWQDFIELGVATWIVCSPFVLGYFDVVNASLSMILLGCAMMLFAILGLATENPMDEWINLALGVGMLASPWLFGFSHLMIATANTVACASVIVVMTILAMTHEYHDIRRLKLSRE